MLNSILDPSQSVAIGVGIGVADLFIFNQHLPPMADIRTAQPHNEDIETARRQATMMCVALNGLVSVMTKDWNVFLIGGVVTVGLSYLSIHANAINPTTGKMDGPTPNMNPDQAEYPMPDYSAELENVA